LVPILRRIPGAAFVAGTPAREAADSVQMRQDGLFERAMAGVFHVERKRVATRSRPKTQRFYSRRKYFAARGNFRTGILVFIRSRAVLLRCNHSTPFDLCSTSSPKMLTKYDSPLLANPY
jgi:hypothetical protein